MSKLSFALGTPFTMLDILGQQYRVRLRSALPAIFSTTSLIFFLVLVLTLWISDPLDYLESIPAGGAFLMWTTGTMIIVCTYVGLLILWSTTSAARVVPIPISIIGLPAFALSTCYHRTLGEFLSGGAWSQDLWPSHLFLIMTQIGFEVLYLRYGLPKSFQDIADKKEAALAPLPPEPDAPHNTEAAPVAKLISLPGEDAIALENVWLVRALEHYVEFHFDQSPQRVVRARLSDFIEQVEESQGIQTHRSWWVSAQAAKQLITENGKRFLELHDGQKIPVSRGRLPDVQQWLADQINL